MALIGHWVAEDGGGAGTTVPDRSASGADMTLFDSGIPGAEATFGRLGSECCVVCPTYADLGPAATGLHTPDSALWDLTDFTIIWRGAFTDTSWAFPAMVGHSEGVGGGFPKTSFYLVNDHA